MGSAAATAYGDAGAAVKRRPPYTAIIGPIPPSRQTLKLPRTSEQPRKPRFFYGWVVVVVAALGSFSASTETFPVLSIFLKPITEEFGWSRTEFTGAISLGGLIGSGAALATGPFVDRFGPRWALTFAYTLIGATFVLMYFMSELWHLYALQIFARSMNTGVLSVASAVIVPNWFIAKRGKATALAGLGFPAGSSIMPLLIAFVAGWYSWREASLGAGVLILIVSAVPTALLLRRRPGGHGAVAGRRAAGAGDRQTIPRPARDRLLNAATAGRAPSRALPAHPSLSRSGGSGAPASCSTPSPT